MQADPQAAANVEQSSLFLRNASLTEGFANAAAEAWQPGQRKPFKATTRQASVAAVAGATVAPGSRICL